MIVTSDLQSDLSFSPAELEAIGRDPVLSAWLDMRLQHIQAQNWHGNGWSAFVPRPDKPEEFDQQHSFVYDRVPMAWCIGGNASGTTECAAAKSARFLLYDQPPPRKDTPFWVASDSYEQVMKTCWVEKFLAHGHIPDCEIDWPRVTWHDLKAGLPKQVPLKPWPGPEHRGKNWVIVFKSYDQGRHHFQSESLGGFWFSEQFPYEIFVETLRGCREYMFPGGQIVEFTPVDPELSVWVEELMEDCPVGWKFYRCNTELNKDNLAEGWFEQFIGTVPDEMLDTRLTGAIATFEGVIYQTFDRSIHVKDFDRNRPPRGAYHARATDWGASLEHPYVTVWGYRDGPGDWYLYDEYWSVDQRKIVGDHAVEVRERSYGWGWPKPGVDDANFGPNYADPSRPDCINEFNQRGVVTMQAANDVYRGIDCVRSLLKVNPYTHRPRLFIHPELKHTIQEHRKYRWKTRRRVRGSMLENPEVIAKPVPLKKEDDCCDAVRYLLFTESLNVNEPAQSADYRKEDERRRCVQLQRTLGRRGGVRVAG